MINLLPPEDKILIRKEYLRRLLVVAGIFLFALISASIILLFPSYFLLTSEKRSFESQLNAIKQSFSREKVIETESSIRELNNKLEVFDKQKKNENQITGPIKKIFDAKSSAIKVFSLSYQKGGQGKEFEQISIKGYAGTRSDFLSFIKTLEAMKEISEVQSPPSNLLKEENFAFNLTLGIKNEK